MDDSSRVMKKILVLSFVLMGFTFTVTQGLMIRELFEWSQPDSRSPGGLDYFVSWRPVGWGLAAATRQLLVRGLSVLGRDGG